MSSKSNSAIRLGAALGAFIVCISCAWDAGFTVDDKVSFLLEKSTRTSELAADAPARLIESRDYILRAMSFDPQDSDVKNALAAIESSIVARKRSEHYTAKTLIARKTYLDAAIRLNNARALRFPDKPEDTTDKSVTASLDSIRPMLQKEIDAQLKSAEKKLAAKDISAAYDMYRRVLRADPGNATAQQKMAQREDQRNAEAAKLADSGRKEYDRGNFDGALRLLKQSYAIKKDIATADLISRISTVQMNRKYSAEAENYRAKGNYLDALRMYRRCKTNDPQNIAYDTQLQALTRNLMPSLDGWLAGGIAKYNESDFESAIELFEKVVMVDDTFKDTRSYLDRSRQKLEAALKAAQ
ncbi:MAG: hypothetical protein HZC28_12965 [Spirochaetes bacterium]|nr:hypothetical protein [Spirochaetota bacterium]